MIRVSGVCDGQARAAGDQILIVIRRQAVFGLLRKRQAVVLNVGVRGTAGERRRQNVVGKRSSWPDSTEMRREPDPWPRLCAALEKFGPGVPSALTIPSESRFQTIWPSLGHIGGKDVVEAAVFADDHDDVFDGCGVSSSRDVVERGRTGTKRR